MKMYTAKKFTRSLGLVIALAMVFLSVDFSLVFAADNSALIREDRIDNLFGVHQELKTQLDKAEDSAEIASIKEEIADVETQLASLGVERPSDDKLAEIMYNNDDTPATRSHPSSLISTFKAVYDVWGFESTYNGKKFYSVVFETKGKDPYLQKAKTTVLYDQILAGSAEAGKWVDELISILVDEAIGSVPVLKYLPYTELFTYKPSPNSVSSYGDATVVILHTVSVQKFTYKYQSSQWVLGSSTNKVSYDLTVTQLIRVNGAAKNVSKDFGTKWENGDFGRAIPLADSQSGSLPINNCISRVKANSRSKNSNFIDLSIHTPNWPQDMSW